MSLLLLLYTLSFPFASFLALFSPLVTHFFVLRLIVRFLIVGATKSASSSKGAFDRDAALLLITEVLENRKQNSRSLEARVEAIENNQVSQWSDPTKQGTDTSSLTHSRRRHLATVDASILEDAALWMQAKNAKILFGQNADANLYRNGNDEIATDSNFIIKKDLNVLGENWHLTMMLTAEENITIGSAESQKICYFELSRTSR